MRLLMVLLLVVGIAAAADVSGKWSIQGDVQGNAVGLDCSALKQTPDGKITGSCTINGGDAVTVNGEVKGDKVRFSFETGGYTLEYAGDLSADAMKGEIQVAGVSGTFEGKRVGK
jgi:hypothetical protein